MDRDVLGGGVEVRLGAVGLGQAGDRGELVVELGRAPGGVVGGRLGRLDLEEHVGALVLDGLEGADGATELHRSEEHTSELQSLMRISYAVFCLKKKKTT